MENRMHFHKEQGLYVTFNPSKNGNCQFPALVHALSEYGIFCSATASNYEVGEYL